MEEETITSKASLYLFDGSNWPAYKLKTRAWVFGTSAICLEVLEGTHAFYADPSPPARPLTTDAELVKAYELEKRIYDQKMTEFMTIKRKVYSHLVQSQKGDLGLTHFQGIDVGDCAGAGETFSACTSPTVVLHCYK